MVQKSRTQLSDYTTTTTKLRSELDGEKKWIVQSLLWNQTNMKLKLHSETYWLYDLKGNSLVVQCLGLRAFTAEGIGSIPGQRIKFPPATWHSKKKNLRP